MGWSATTPLWYTLQLDNQYLHTGYKKEGGFLQNIDCTPAQRFLIEKGNKKKRGQSKSEHMREWVENRVEKNQELLKKIIMRLLGILYSYIHIFLLKLFYYVKI